MATLLRCSLLGVNYGGGMAPRTARVNPLQLPTRITSTSKVSGAPITNIVCLKSQTMSILCHKSIFRVVPAAPKNGLLVHPGKRILAESTLASSSGAVTAYLIHKGILHTNFDEDIGSPKAGMMRRRVPVAAGIADLVLTHVVSNRFAHEIGTGTDVAIASFNQSTHDGCVISLPADSTKDFPRHGIWQVNNSIDA
jgi:hypothetical protein